MKSRVKQNGLVLITGLIMLVIVTLLAVSAIKMSNVNLRIVGNEQAVNAMEAAAQQAIEQTIQTTNFAAHPTPTMANVTINNSTINAATVKVDIPECMGSVADTGNSMGMGTLPGAQQTTYWDIKATVTDSTTGATVEIHQGVKVPSLSGC